MSLRAQRMWLCDFDRYSYITPITSGRIGVDTKTPTGKYTIQDPSRDTTLRPGTGESYFVKYWIPFDAPDYGFHDSSWQKIPYGSQRYKTDGSHGCIHVPLKAIEFLFDWASVGTPVDIHA